MAQWVNFKTIKDQVSIEQILEHYGLLKHAKRKGHELRIRCPFHEDTQPSCTANMEKNGFHCFGCGAKGNIFGFVRLKEEIDSGDRNADDRKAALLIVEWFGIASSKPEDAQVRTHKARAVPPVKTTHPGAEPAHEEKPVVVNPPLGWELKQLDVEAGKRYAQARGLTPEIAEAFGLAVALAGGYKGRLIIPLHDHDGVLIGYAARALNETEPKYLFPSSEKGFHKSYLVYNLWRVAQEQPRSVVVTEGFFDVMKLTQAGYPAVALMGSSLAEAQAALLYTHFRHIVLLFDGDEAGRRATEECLRTLGRRRYVRAIALPDEVQPDQLSTEDLNELLRYG